MACKTDLQKDSAGSVLSSQSYGTSELACYELNRISKYIHETFTSTNSAL